MNRRLWVYVRGFLLVVILCSTWVIAQTETSNHVPTQSFSTVSIHLEEYERFARALSPIVEPLRYALYFTSQGGFEPYIPEDQRIRAQALINLLEGLDSPLYDELVELPAPFREGIRPILDSVEFTPGGLDASAYSRAIEGLVEIRDDLLSRFRLASLAAQQAADTGLDSADGADALTISQSLLFVAHEIIVSILKRNGLEIWVQPGESIQAAIDLARDGATIYIESGVYRETLEITKSITLDGWAFNLLPEPPAGEIGYTTTLQPVASQTGITISSSEPIHVIIRQITIEDASQGIEIAGNAQVVVEQLGIIESEVGVRISDSASLDLLDCYLDFNELAILLADSSTTSISDSIIQHSTGTLAAIHVLADAFLEMTNTEVFQSGGHGILVQDQAELVLSGSLITYNDGDGIRLTGSSMLTMNGTSCNGNAGFGVRALTSECPSNDDVQYDDFVGIVVGEANFLPARGELGENRQGGMCPESLQFLTDRPE